MELGFQKIWLIMVIGSPRNLRLRASVTTTALATPILSVYSQATNWRLKQDPVPIAKNMFVEAGPFGPGTQNQDSPRWRDAFRSDQYSRLSLCRKVPKFVLGFQGETTEKHTARSTRAPQTPPSSDPPPAHPAAQRRSSGPPAARTDSLASSPFAILAAFSAPSFACIASVLRPMRACQWALVRRSKVVKM